ncbi:MAG: hypothetical protein ABIL67_03880 [candidate division WOR-3 bacterium]
MKRLALLTLFISCAGGTLPSNPRISKVIGGGDGKSLYIYWYYLEGADSFTVYGVDSTSLGWILTTKDTFALITTPYKKLLVFAYAPSDIRMSDTINVSPYYSHISLYSYGSGQFSGVCFKDSISPCNPEDGDNFAYLLFVLDSLRLISPSRDTAKFGHRETLFKPYNTDYPIPPSGYEKYINITPYDTLALWLDFGVSGNFDEGDYLGKVVVDSIHYGDHSRDSIRVYLKIWHGRISRLSWFF